eukprot:364277-Chlamydomonas_euryale.AAC.10
MCTYRAAAVACMLERPIDGERCSIDEERHTVRALVTVHATALALPRRTPLQPNCPLPFRYPSSRAASPPPPLLRKRKAFHHFSRTRVPLEALKLP